MAAEILNDLPEHVRPWFLRARPIEFRPVDPINRFCEAKYPARQILWFRAVGALSEAQAVISAFSLTVRHDALDTYCWPHEFTLFAGALQPQVSIMRCGFNRPSGRRSGCSTFRKAQARRARAGSIAAPSPP